MAIESVRAILRSLNQSAAWQQQQEFDCLVKSWSEVVGPVVGQHSRPLELRDGKLVVTTSNAVWAQQLRFECPRILAKLKDKLAEPLQEIRFSPARWHQSSVGATELLSAAPPRHPCRPSPFAHNVESRVKGEVSQTSQAAFQRWAAKVRSRSQGLPLCPQCSCPTPLGELQHWSVCALCAVKPGCGSC